MKDEEQQPGASPAPPDAPTPPNWAAEARSLRIARWAFLLLAANLLLQLVLYVWAGFTQAELDPEEDQVKARLTPSARDYAAQFGSTLLTLTPATTLLVAGGRSPRWRIAAWVLLSCSLADLGGILWLFGHRQHGVAMTVDEPFAVRAALFAYSGVSWLELWCMAVVVAEFSLAARQKQITARTMTLGNFILFGFAACAIGAAWMLPSPPDPLHPDPMSLTLQIANDIAYILSSIWLLQLLTVSATVARIYAGHSTKKGQTPETPPAG